MQKGFLAKSTTGYRLKISATLTSEVVVDVPRPQVVALGSLNSGKSSYLKIRHGVAGLACDLESKSNSVKLRVCTGRGISFNS